LPHGFLAVLRPLSEIFLPRGFFNGLTTFEGIFFATRIYIDLTTAGIVEFTICVGKEFIDF